MRRVRSLLGYIVLTVLLGIGFIPSSGFAQTGIVVSPPNPTQVDSLELTITAGCCMMPVWINSVAIEVSEGLIRIIADRECGPFMMPTLYTHTVMVPPVDPDSYIIEYWVTGSCLIAPNPILTTTTIVLPLPVQADGETWGAIKALFQ
jgi:hypothetical protein